MALQLAKIARNIAIPELLRESINLMSKFFNKSHGMPNLGNSKSGSKSQSKRSRRNKSGIEFSGRGLGKGSDHMTTTYLGDPLVSNTIYQGGYLNFAGHARPNPAFAEGDSLRIAGRSRFTAVGKINTSYDVFIDYPTEVGAQYLGSYNNAGSLLIHPNLFNSSRLSQIGHLFRKYAIRYLKLTYVSDCNTETYGSCIIGMISDPALIGNNLGAAKLAEVSGSVSFPWRLNSASHFTYDGDDTWYADDTIDTDAVNAEIRQHCQGVIMGTSNKVGEVSNSAGYLMCEYVIDYYDSTPLILEPELLKPKRRDPVPKTCDTKDPPASKSSEAKLPDEYEVLEAHTLLSSAGLKTKPLKHY